MKARKKPVEIEFLTFDELEEKHQNYPNIKPIYIDDSELSNKDRIARFEVKTLEGTMSMRKNDYLIIGVQGEVYPCKIDIFNETYDIIRASILEPYQQRLLDEALHETKKLNKLNKFIEGEVFPTLPREKKDLMLNQIIIMEKFVRVLNKRLELEGIQFTKKED